jgi:tetratricopeptide (TPR) repeat protein
MKLHRLKQNRHTALVLVMVFLWIYARHRISEMDERFFQPSLLGVKGLALYALGDYGGAADAYRAHFQEVYQTDRASHDPAWDSLLQGDLKTAKEISEKSLEEDSTSTGQLLNLGEISLEENDPDQAVTIFARILQKDPDHFDALLLSAVARTRSGAYGKAVDLLRKALRKTEFDSRITSFLAVLKTAGNLAGMPKGRKPLCLLAQYHLYLQAFDPSNARAAVVFAKEAIAAGDRPDDAYLTMGIVYFKEGKTEKALHAFLKAIEVNPRNVEAHRWAIQIYAERGDLLNEYRIKKAIYEISPDDPSSILRFSQYLEDRLGDYDQALALTLKALETQPDNVSALKQVGRLSLRMKRPQRSLEYFQKALGLAPRNPSLHEGLGESLFALGREKEGEEAYRKALSLDLFQARPHLRLAMIYRDEKRYDDAVKEYEEGLRFGKDEAASRVPLCALYHQLSMFPRAAACFKQVLSEEPHNALAQHLLPYTLKNLNQ